MSIEQEIAGLTQSTTDLLGAVNTKKATLDSAVSNAQTAVVDATSQVSLAAAEKVGAQTARDEAETHKDLAYTYSQSAASAVAYQDLTAIAQTKSETAVDVFVYDTRKDSDGGAWRQRTQGTSWYNETLNTATRGSRKEFPAVAVIVIEYSASPVNTLVITIYDGDDPSLPMWMTFIRDGGVGPGVARNMIPGVADARSVTALNGVLILASSETNRGGLHTVSFLKDSGFHYSGTDLSGTNGASIANRNASYPSIVDNSKGNIVSNLTNDVAMTVLPNAPIDPATGLPIPTIAVATDGGVSVIKDDGTVVDITSVAVPVVSNVGFTAGKKVIFNVDSSAQGKWVQVFDIPDSDLTYSYTQEDNNIYQTYNSVNEDRLTLCPNTTQITASTYAFDNYIGGWTVNGLGIGTTNYYYGDNGNKNLVNYITSTYNTGWMNGDIKLATLSDTDDTDLVGSELVTNGTFDTDTSGWASQLGAILTNVNNQLSVESVGNNSLAYQIFPADLNKQYILNITVVEGTCTVVTAGWSAGTLAVGTHVVVIKAGRSNNKLDIVPPTGGITVVDNISITLAEQDRSVNGNGLQVFGTVQKNPVATGADLVAYSGFTTSNYLRQPYNPALDFGAGDFCIMGWFKRTSTGYHLLAVKADDSNNHRLQVYCNAGANNIILYTLDNGLPSYASTSNSGYTTGSWNHFVGVRSNSGIKVYINGKDSTATELNNGAMDLTSEANATFTLGAGDIGSGVQSPFDGSLALWRISGTAPTAEQVAKIYRDEKPLFQEGAQATLYGTSDAVTALAYDTDTELLHVGSSAGRSVFQGLQRVDNTTDAVGTAISASNNLVVEE